MAYASRTAAQLGLMAGIVTTADSTLDWRRYLPGVQIVRHPAAVTTTFENVYQAGRRIQRLLAVADPVPAGAVPAEWTNCPIVQLAPVVHEVTGDFLGLFPDSLIGLTPQGLLREWDASGLVRQGRWRGDDRLLSGSRVVVVSEEDLAGDPGFLAVCLARVPITVVTRGDRGATLFERGKASHLPAFPVKEVDPTGAGDVFAAAFLVEYHRTGDPYRSAAFASCAASFAVERWGLEGVPTREMVEERLARYP